MNFDGSGYRFGDHFGIKIASKNRSKNQSDFGSILEGFWLPIWLHFGPILAPKIDQKSRSKKDRFLENVRGESGVPKVVQGGPIYHRNPIDKGIEMYNSSFYTPSSAAADFSSVLGVFLGPWTFKNECLV